MNFNPFTTPAHGWRIDAPYAQYTPPTRLDCRVDSRRPCVLNSHLVHDGFAQKMKTKHIENLSSRLGCRIENWVTTETPPDTTQLDS